MNSNPVRFSRDDSKVEEIVKHKSEVHKLLNLPVEGRFWYVLDYQWWNKWCSFIDAATSGDSLDVAFDDYPGEIDNTALLAPDGKLKPDLLREEDLTVIPEEVWNIFVKQYGCVHKDTTVFKRTAVQTPSGRWIVEIYPPHFSFVDLVTLKPYFDAIFSESQAIGGLRSIIKKRLNLANNTKVRLFVREGAVVEELINDDVTIGEASLERKKTLYVRLDTIDGLKANHASAGELAKLSDGASALSASSSGNFLHQASSSTQHKPGVCGLTNLGNTCFMNSALQCMSNVPELTNFFLGDWRREINKRNPLGTQGRLATAYAELINRMWSGQCSYEVPRAFKREIASVASQFSGCAQHDAHELLVFLLDGLHEDLNRVVTKPYVEVEDAGDRPDEIVAKESWLQHKARNDSIIVDYFHGQLKSTVICPTCKYRSVTFDPFASLNLPLPEVSTFFKVIRLWPWNRSDQTVGPLKYQVSVRTEFTVEELLSSLESIRPPSVGMGYYVTEVYNHSMNRAYRADHLIRDRYGPPLFVYELPPGELIPVRWHRPNPYNNTSGWVGIPFYISIPGPDLSSVDELYLIRAIVSRLEAIGITSVGADEDGNAILTAHPAKQDSDSDSMEDEPDENGPIDIARLLANRVHLTDDFNQDVIDLSNGVKVDLSDRPFVRILVDCANSSLHEELQQMMNAISRPVTQANSSKTSIDLAQCMDKFVSIERLGAHDLWYCRRCKQHRQATKKFDLWSLPKVLVVQLKRFRSTSRFRDKIDTTVVFPVKDLDLGPWVTRNTNEQYKYDLIAVINHMGCLYGGHYTAYALNHQSQHWYRFNDASTSEMDESQVVTNSAYVLVYRRREDKSGNSSPQSNGLTDSPSSTQAEPSNYPTPMYIDDADLENVE